MKIRHFGLTVLIISILTASHLDAQNEPFMQPENITALHNDKYGSGVQGSHFIVNEHLTEISNNMAKTIGIPEQYGVENLPEDELEQPDTPPRHRQQRLSGSSFTPTGLSFTEMSNKITTHPETRQRHRIQLYNN